MVDVHTLVQIHQNTSQSYECGGLVRMVSSLIQNWSTRRQAQVFDPKDATMWRTA